MPGSATAVKTPGRGTLDGVLGIPDTGRRYRCYAKDVETVAAFYVGLGFEEHFRLPGPDGMAGFIGLRRDNAELAVTTEESPRALAGVEPGPGPRHELFVYLDDVDQTVARLRDEGASVLREPADMPWGERVAFLADPEGNVVSLATA